MPDKGTDFYETPLKDSSRSPVRRYPLEKTKQQSKFDEQTYSYRDRSYTNAKICINSMKTPSKPIDRRVKHRTTYAYSMLSLHRSI